MADRQQQSESSQDAAARLLSLRARLSRMQQHVMREIQALTAEIDEVLALVRDEVPEDAPAEAPAAPAPARQAFTEPRPIAAPPPPPPPDLPDAMERTHVLVMPIRDADSDDDEDEDEQALGMPVLLPVSQSLEVPKEAERAKTLMYSLHQAVENLMGDPVIPGTDVEVDPEMREYVLSACQHLIQAFLQMHNRCKSRAGILFQRRVKRGEKVDDPGTYWAKEDLDGYKVFCTRGLVEAFLDVVEKRIHEVDVPEYECLLDFLAGVVNLERIRVQLGVTRADRSFHQSEMGAEVSAGVVIESMSTTGYVDRSRNAVVRKAGVRTTSNHGGPRAANQETVEFVRPEKPGELPLPEKVAKCVKQVAQVKSAVTRLLAGGRIPRTGVQLNMEVAALIQEYSEWIQERFQEIHRDCVRAAKARFDSMPKDDVERALRHAWHEQLLARYDQFVMKCFMEGFLDRLDAKIHSFRLKDHTELVAHFAREMDLGRLHIEPRLTLYDPERHVIQGEVHVTWREELLRARVVSIIRHGYTDLATGTLIRKALVQVRLPKRQWNPSAQTEADGSMAIDLDLT